MTHLLPRQKLEREFLFDPNLCLYLPLYELDGGSFMSKDAYGHLCTVIGALWRPSGRTFDGIDDAIDFTPAITMTDDFTLIAWLKRSDEVGYDFWLAGVSNDDRVAWVEANTYIIVAGNPVWSQSGAAPIVGRWSFVVLKRIDGTLYLSIDNKDPISDAGNSGTSYWETVGSQAGHSLSWGGSIGEVWIYNRGLNRLEDQRNYLATKWRYQ